MASADSKFDELPDADIDSLNDDAIPNYNYLGNICLER